MNVHWEVGPGASQRMQEFGGEVSSRRGLRSTERCMVSLLSFAEEFWVLLRERLQTWQPGVGVSHRAYTSMVLAAHPCSGSQFLFPWYDN